LLTEYSQQVDALLDGLSIFLVHEELASLEASRGGERQVVRVYTGRTGTRFKVDDHSSVGCEIACTAEALIARFAVRQFVL
jgi:hypothetical protein